MILDSVRSNIGVFLDGEALVPCPRGRWQRWRLDRCLTLHGRDVDIRSRLQRRGYESSPLMVALLEKVQAAFPTALVTDDALHARLLVAWRDCLPWDYTPRVEIVASLDDLRKRMQEAHCLLCMSNLFLRDSPMGGGGIVRYRDVDDLITKLLVEVVR